MKPGLTCNVNYISAIIFSLSYLLLPAATQPPYNPGPDPYSDPSYSEVDYQASAPAPASAPTVTLRIRPSINGDASDETFQVPLEQFTEYRADEPRYKSARAGSTRLPSKRDIERAVIVDGPGDSDEIVCMFNGSPEISDVRYGPPFAWGEEVSFTGANSISCIAFYWKGEEGQGGNFETVNNEEDFDGFDPIGDLQNFWEQRGF